MKFIAAFILVVVVAVSAELTVEQLRKIATRHNECIAETGVKPEVVTDASHGNIANDPKLNEHILCVFKKTGFIDDAGKLHKDVIEEKLLNVVNDKDLVKKTIDACSVKKETPQLTARENYKCYLNKTGFALI